MLSSNNILLPSNGRPVASPSQDMVIGCYYLTKAPLSVQDAEETLAQPRASRDRKETAQKQLDEVYVKAPRFGRYSDVEMALALGSARFNTPAWFWVERPADEAEDEDESPRGKWIRTTTGRIVFNSVVPREMGFWNSTMGKKELGEIIFQSYRNVGLRRTTEFLDALKDFGFRYATLGGISVGLVDLEIPEDKQAILKDAEEEVARFTRAYQNGVISNGERYNKVIDTWTHANNDVADAMVRRLERSGSGFNPVYMMMNSGARGNRDQMRQLAGMRGLMAKPQKKLTGGIGEIIESPIKSNFREGLTVLEYFISTHVALKCLVESVF
jgi:DNA-directed RNA polymerase subunit beta'